MSKIFSQFKALFLKKSLNFKIIFVLVFFLVIGGSGMAVFLKSTFNNIILEQIHSKGSGVLKTLCQSIDPEIYKRLSKDLNPEDKDYKRLITLFQEVKTENELKYLYTESLLSDGQTTVYVLDGSDPSTDEFSPIGTKVNEIEIVDTEESLKTLNEGIETFSLPYTSEQWGELASVYYPIKDAAGKVLGFIGGDFSVEQLRKEVNEVYYITIGIMILIIGTVILIISFVLSKLSIPIMKLTDNLYTAVQNVSATSEELAATSEQLAKANASQVGFINETAFTLEATTKKINNNTKNTKKASEIAYHTKEFSEQGSVQITEMTEFMNEILHSSAQIEKIIKVINDLSFQTRILALNASVEAARAGDEGVGFVVVASEVKNLALKSAQAAKDIEKIIKQNINITEKGRKIVQKTGEVLNEISLETRNVSELISEIAETSSDQYKEIAQTGTSIINIEKITQENAATAEESAAASQVFKDQAIYISGIVKDLEKLVNGQKRTLEKSTPDQKNKNKKAKNIKLKQNSKSFTEHLPMTPKNSLPERSEGAEKVIPLNDDKLDF